ncbi:hypothetical protein BGZ60DRAFT_545662 [Tricladium varicosporioides]|nr:hypothetical protein BGZ60DRAFT_545662 [Hymenoscyphus varicosporioides]
MAEKIKNLVLVGGSGNIGAAILTALLATSQFTITILTRASSTATFPSSPSLRIIRSDYSLSSIISAFQDQDAVICALGQAGIGEEIKLIDAAVAAGVKRFIPAEYGVNTINQNVLPLFSGAMDIKMNVLDHLKNQEIKGLTWTGIATGPFFDWGLYNNVYGLNINSHTAMLVDGGNRAFSVTTLSQTAAAILAVLAKPTETANQYIYVHSFTVSQKQILSVLEEQEGRQWELQEVSSEELTKDGKALLSKGNFTGALKLLHVCFLGEGFGSDFTKDVEGGVANGWLGLPKQDLNDEVKKIYVGQVQ